ncbi:hypothetical protein A6M27_18115 [Acidithiobacillus thiooxidans]|jgi:hypothetical protein|uniref:Uncharacterized protein n=1 Tax=Acidithiobacillus thiooxidans TaxID=930 RepID=A0A1C2J1T5_ACITH|nr:hypothetical protein [Acidithiobacillus thiooxidans]OCX67991.1 hypothetical protein A6P07_19005 [Acidithiobacillus thiooxidans]OCX78144.1 hypothetical protein A6O24_05100 [Acidithiobacillus thiooxidans]OCX82213.1 hypothetical protein A6O26_10470 [Acidithiobacillus thiooxidans]OCX83015.1 hypothetical protein A6M27_18115 [Acidithiobacillus thiooxidans]OFC50199.1 hypothetical protein BAE47_02445 [Acidithiobacillus thiooxidans]
MIPENEAGLPHAGPRDEEADRINEAVRIFKGRPDLPIFACACLGPRTGEPECPCRMARIIKVQDVYYQIVMNGRGQVSAKRYQKLG